MANEFLPPDKRSAVWDKVLAFATSHDLRMLTSSRHWFVDGKFFKKIQQKKFGYRQLLIIGSKDSDETVNPRFFVLLKGQSKAEYKEIFSALKESINI